jgi:hypothetical protein
VSVKKDKQKPTETEFQTGYEPQSSLSSLETLLPKNHVDAVRRSLEAVQEKYGDIDKFVAKELGFTPSQLADAFAAEQVDALALAIANHKIGEAFIIGDQTGVGKGRAAAGMIRYAQRQGLLPVFVTTSQTPRVGCRYRTAGSSSRPASRPASRLRSRFARSTLAMDSRPR